MTAAGPTFNEPRAAFDAAITEGRLSAIPAAINFAGHYMYMGTVNGRDLFKHRDTRKYLTAGLTPGVRKR